jgi:hypothetical protein
MDYVTCTRRKNAPQINVLVCEKKCPHRNKCSAYLNHARMQSLAASLGDCAGSADELLLRHEPARLNRPSATGK